MALEAQTASGGFERGLITETDSWSSALRTGAVLLARRRGAHMEYLIHSTEGEDQAYGLRGKENAATRYVTADKLPVHLRQRAAGEESRLKSIEKERSDDERAVNFSSSDDDALKRTAEIAVRRAEHLISAKWPRKASKANCNGRMSPKQKDAARGPAVRKPGKKRQGSSIDGKEAGNPAAGVSNRGSEYMGEVENEGVVLGQQGSRSIERQGGAQQGAEGAAGIAR
eukprot:6182533-Pleurochrysis_carterae.AAC.1